MYHIHKTGLIFILYKGKELGRSRKVGNEYKDIINRIWTPNGFKCILSHITSFWGINVKENSIFTQQLGKNGRKQNTPTKANTIGGDVSHQRFSTISVKLWKYVYFDHAKTSVQTGPLFNNWKRPKCSNFLNSKSVKSIVSIYCNTR